MGYPGIYATTGTILRAHPRMRVLRGYDPTRPTQLGKNAPVANNVVIYSGQAIQLNWNSSNQRFEWNLAGQTYSSTDAQGNTVTAHATDPVYFANADAADPDIISADSLPALPCYGQFELQTGWYTGPNGAVVSGATWNHGVPITADTTNYGNIMVTTVGSGAPVIGMVSGIEGPQFLGQVDPSTSNPPTYYAPYAAQDSSASNLYVVQLVTRHDPANAA